MNTITRTVQKNSEVTLLPNTSFSRNGYNLIGWNDSSSKTSTSPKYSCSQVKSDGFPQDVSLYACWERKNEVKYFHDLYNEKPYEYIQSEFVDYGEAAKHKPTSEASRQGWMFSNWSDRTGNAIDLSSIKEDIDAYAFLRKIVDLSIDFRYGDRSEILFIKQLLSSDSITSAYIYDKFVKNKSIDGYIFKKFDPSQEEYTITTNTTISILYDLDEYTITYHGNGQTEGYTDSSTHIRGIPKSLSKNYFTKLGHEFDHWNTSLYDSGTSYSDEQIVTNVISSGSECSLYAQWKKIKYTVSIAGNASINVRLNGINGEHVSDGQSINYGTILYVDGSLPEDTDSYHYHSLNIVCNNQTIHPGTSVSIESDIIISITCQSELKYKLTVSSDDVSKGVVNIDGDSNIITKEFIEGQTPIVNAIPAEGCVFVSWSDGGLSSHNVLINSDKIITAHFDRVANSSVTNNSSTTDNYDISGCIKSSAASFNENKHVATETLLSYSFWS